MARSRRGRFVILLNALFDGIIQQKNIYELLIYVAFLNIAVGGYVQERFFIIWLKIDSMLFVPQVFIHYADNLREKGILYIVRVLLQGGVDVVQYLSSKDIVYSDIYHVMAIERHGWQLRSETKKKTAIALILTVYSYG